MNSLEQTTLSGWGNIETQNCFLAEASSAEEAKSFIQGNAFESWIPRGLGRAYGDSALNRDQGVLRLQHNNGKLSFDPQARLAECGAGVSLKRIIEHVLPLGYFLPVTPGTKHVTVGGAIAADVHGKNQFRQGSFGNHVEELTLLTPQGEILRCASDENEHLLRATIGGMGLTGVILSAKLRLSPIQTSYMHVVYRHATNLDATLEWMEEAAKSNEQLISWLDLRARPSKLVHSIVMTANSASVEQLPAKFRRKPVKPVCSAMGSVPCFAPGFAINRATRWLFNALYSYKHRNGERIVHFDAFLYPQDKLDNWNRLYGKRGFVDYQVLFPPETSRSGLIALLEELKAEQPAVCMAVLKLFGKPGKGLLSFTHPGFTLSVDFPHTGASLTRFIRKLDALVLKHDGRLYLAKDALMEPATFQAMYPELETFCEVKAKYDPNLRFSSSQARRLGMFSSIS